MEAILSVVIIFLVGAVLLLSMENFAKRKEIKRLEDEINRRDSEDEGAAVVVEYLNGEEREIKGIKTLSNDGKVITLRHTSGDILASLNLSEVRAVYSANWIKEVE